MTAAPIRRNGAHCASPAREHEQRAPRWLRAQLVVVALAVLLSACVVDAGRKDAKVRHTDVTITLGASAVSVPNSFFGLSTEYWAMPIYERRLSVFEHVLSLLRVRGDGPLILRVGGDSADLTYWNPDLLRPSAGAFVLTPGWFQQAGKLVTQLRLRVILDLNLISDLPNMAVAEARAALARLPAGSVEGFEIGNEPDRFGHGYTIHSYVRDFRSFARALIRVRPNVTLMGPAITNAAVNFEWLRQALAYGRPELRVLTGHRYPLNACRRPGSPGYPTVARVLRQSSSAGIAQAIGAAVRLAHQARRPFRLDELNSVTCGGLQGVSDTFASALWAPDALFALLSTGLDGLNIHIRPDKINAPFVLERTGLIARPLLYGLVLFVRALGDGRQLVQLHMHPARSGGLTAWGVRAPRNKVHVLLINKGTQLVNVSLGLLHAGSEATVERLLAPSLRAIAGVTLDGQRLSRDGSWLGQKVVQRLRQTPTGYRLTVPPLSAALVTFEVLVGRS